MKKLFYLFTLFTIVVNAQIVNLKIIDLSDNLPLDDADIYFKNSTKNFVSDLEGKTIVDLSNIEQTDELIVSKKDYQNATIKVSDLKSDMIIKLEKVNEIELKEAFVTNLKAEDILKKVIENYAKNFNTEEHYYKINFMSEAVIDSVNRDLIDVDLQFRFKKDQVKIHSNNVVNERIIGEGSILNSSYSMFQYFKNISLLEVTKRMLNRFGEKYYDEEYVQISKYTDKYMYEIEFSNQQSKVKNWFLIDKETFAIVEHQSKIDNNMPYRILNYCIDIIQEWKKSKKINQNTRYPIIVPIIIYTGNEKWKIPKNFKEKQISDYVFENYKIDLEYNLIEINKLSKSFLLQKQSLFGYGMIIEKSKNKQELKENLELIVKHAKNKKQLYEISDIIYYLLNDTLEEVTKNELLEKLEIKIKKGDIMSDLYERLVNENREMIRKGKKEGKIEGKIEGKLEVAKRLIKKGIDEKIIIESTEINKEELLKLKKEVL